MLYNSRNVGAVVAAACAFNKQQQQKIKMERSPFLNNNTSTPWGVSSPLSLSLSLSLSSLQQPLETQEGLLGCFAFYSPSCAPSLGCPGGLWRRWIALPSTLSLSLSLSLSLLPPFWRIVVVVRHSSILSLFEPEGLGTNLRCSSSSFWDKVWGSFLWTMTGGCTSATLFGLFGRLATSFWTDSVLVSAWSVLREETAIVGRRGGGEGLEIVSFSSFRIMTEGWSKKN